ncbi:MAG: UvrD-helicase domain-containing protein [Acidimicrobiales bacterium]
MSSPVLDEIAARSDEADRLTAVGMETATAALASSWSTYEFEQARRDLLLLSSERDAFYDRPTVGIAYGWWYHLRRVNGLLATVDRLMGDEEVDLIDIGSGTGATAWAATMVTMARQRLGLPVAPVRIHEIDASLDMGAVADTLWRTLQQWAPDAMATVTRERTVASWTTTEIVPRGKGWLVASYLLDHSDLVRSVEIGDELLRLMQRCRLSGATLLSTRSKLELLKQAATPLVDAGWSVTEARSCRGPWRGTAAVTDSAYRATLDRLGLAGKGQAVVFDHGESMSMELTAGAVAVPMLEDPGWLWLNDRQREVVESQRPARLVTGAAGSGKSVVIAGAIARKLEHPRPRPPQHLLVTAFNKPVVDLVHRLLLERMEGSTSHWTRVTDLEGFHRYRDVGRHRDELTLINFDKLPGRCFAIDDLSVVRDDVWVTEVATLLDRLRNEDERFRSLPEGNRLLDPTFYLAELSRVVYGLDAELPEAYLEAARTGRGVALKPEQRRMVADVLQSPDLPETFTHRRLSALRSMRAHALEPFVDALYIDEGQDFLPADFELAMSLLRPGGEVLVVVDEAQALHIGNSYRRPQPPQGVRWQRHELAGSYRLPASIAHAVAPLAEAVATQRRRAGIAKPDLVSPQSRKAAVVGVRPIVVVGDVATHAQHIARIHEHYAPLVDIESRSRKITVVERDHALVRALKATGTPAGSRSVLEIKGLERGMVVWSSRPTLRIDETDDEVIYTALTRTTSVLVLAIDPIEIAPGALATLRHLDPHYLMFWNDESARWWSKAVEH